MPCGCKNTRCLLLYCECFAAMVLCSMACHCQECENTQNSKSRVEASRKRRKRRSSGCNCIKSRCLKKYCECYAAGRGCEDNCNCIGCKNPPGQRPDASPRTKRTKRVESVRTPVKALTSTDVSVEVKASSGTHMGNLPPWTKGDLDACPPFEHGEIWLSEIFIMDERGLGCLPAL